MGCCEYGNEPSDSMKYIEFLNYKINYRLLKKSFDIGQHVKLSLSNPSQCSTEAGTELNTQCDSQISHAYIMVLSFTFVLLRLKSISD
jgi:hypothetical protein